MCKTQNYLSSLAVVDPTYKRFENDEIQDEDIEAVCIRLHC